MKSCEGLFLVFVFGFRSAFVFLTTAIGRWNSNMSNRGFLICAEDKPAKQIFCAVCHGAISMHWSCAAGKYLPCFYKKLLEWQKQCGQMCVVCWFCKSLQKSFRNFCMAFIPLCNMDTTGPLPASSLTRQ